MDPTASPKGSGVYLVEGAAPGEVGGASAAAPFSDRISGTPAGKAMFQMMGVFAEFERAMIVERVKAGLSRAASISAAMEFR
jgi:hypothetical protein